MCEPTTIGAISIGLTALSTVMGVMGQQQQSKAAQEAANYNAQVAAGEAETQRSLARMEIQRGEEERNRVIRAGLAKQGEIAAGLGAAGFTLDQGTNLSLLGQNAEEIQHDASIAAQNANMAAWGRLAGANRAENEGAFSLFQGKAAKAAAGPAMAGTVLGGLGQGLTQYQKYKETQTPKVK